MLSKSNRGSMKERAYLRFATERLLIKPNLSYLIESKYTRQPQDSLSLFLAVGIFNDLPLFASHLIISRQCKKQNTLRTAP